MKQNKKEELQSRRQFFKKAAKTALPILGAIALANMPLSSIASVTPNSCSTSSCSGSCSGACAWTCKGSCEGTCDGACKGTCKAYCQAQSK